MKKSLLRSAVLFAVVSALKAIKKENPTMSACVEQHNDDDDYMQHTNVRMYIK